MKHSWLLGSGIHTGRSDVGILGLVEIPLLAVMLDSVKVRPEYTGYWIQARRNSDDATQDFAFGATASMIAWAEADSATSVTVARWHNQGSLGGYAAQTDTTKQPEIWNSVDGIRVDSNGNVSAYWDGVNDYIDFTFASPVAQPNTQWTMWERVAAGTANAKIVDGLSASDRELFFLSSSNAQINAGSTLQSTAYPMADRISLATLLYNNTSSIIRIDGAEKASGAAGAGAAGGLRIGSRYNGTDLLKGFIPCLYFDTTDQTANFDTIDATLLSLKGIASETRVACIGDSFTVGVGATDPTTENYPYVLDASTGWRVLCQGTSGASAAAFTSHFVTYDTLLHDVTALVMWEAGDNPGTPAELVADYQAAIAVLPASSTYLVLGLAMTSDVSSWNDALAIAFPSNYLDIKALWQTETGDPGFAAYLSGDSVHPNTAGYASTAAAVESALQALGVS